jgi:hypothetical protein
VLRLLRNLLLHNWHLKLLSLAIAFLLWSAYTAEPVGEVGYLVPLEYRNVPEGLELADEVPTQVHLRLQGRSALLRRLTPADLALAVDLSESEPGEALVRLEASQANLPPGAKVVRISPATIRVLLIPPEENH